MAEHGDETGQAGHSMWPVSSKPFALIPPRQCGAAPVDYGDLDVRGHRRRPGGTLCPEATAMPVRVLIVDDQEPFRMAARMVVDATEDSIHIHTIFPLVPGNY